MMVLRDSIQSPHNLLILLPCTLVQMTALLLVIGLYNQQARQLTEISNFEGGKKEYALETCTQTLL
jgi:hypothetical protein